MFSNSLPPSIVAASIQVLELLESTDESLHLFHRLHDNTLFFRQEIQKVGFVCLGESYYLSDHDICYAIVPLPNSNYNPRALVQVIHVVRLYLW